MTIPRILTGLMTLLMAATGAAVSAPNFGSSTRHL